MHIYLISPSGAVRDKAALRLGVKRLKQLGHDVELDPDALSTEQRFAGDDDARVLAVSRAAAQFLRHWASGLVSTSGAVLTASAGAGSSCPCASAWTASGA